MSLPIHCEIGYKKNISDIVLLNCHKPCVFKVINSVLNAPQTRTEASPAGYENFLHHFIDKVTSTSALIIPPVYDPSMSVPCSAVLDTFEPVTLPVVQKIESHFKLSHSPNNTVLPRLFKEVFPTVGPSCLSYY